MRILGSLSVLVLLLLVSTARAEDEKEKKISVSDCPKAVQRTLKRETAKGKVVDVDVREIKGVSIYESETRFGDLEYDIVIRGDGVLLAKRLETDGKNEGAEDADDENEGDDEDGDEKDEVETPVQLADLPKQVARTLAREAGDGKIEEIVKEQEGDKIVYEAEVEFKSRKGGDLDYEIEIAEDGTLICKALEEEEGKEAKGGDAKRHGKVKAHDDDEDEDHVKGGDDDEDDDADDDDEEEEDDE